ncbi:MAG: L-serine ammonia-lyase, iron-sulfur-dependent, subunit alpha [Dysgonamonadaceae bacterium]|jgi:L-cysteine desulfidase|nr:L-serine ammonia-lyase, iron-sulfur-dependent, subunit alpha [Dysgonamonadaceae bacterium]
MIIASEKDKILKLIRQEVVPAIGCTEPVAVSLAVARAAEILGALPEKIQVYLSANVLKNAMGVGIPGTGMIGLPIAIALGALIGKPEYRLEVLKEITPEALDAGKKMIDEKRISVLLKEDTEDKLYIEAICSDGNNRSRVIIRHQHTNICFEERNGRVLLDTQQESGEETGEDTVELTLRKVYDFAMEMPLDEICFILDSGRMNKNAALESFKHNFGHALGKTLIGRYEKQIMGDGLLSKMLSNTSAACDARMAGAMISVMSNSGSGNQGLTTTVPVIIYAEETNQPEEKLIRALMLSNLTVIYIKQNLGRLSALCGCVVASTGSSCGITYLMGGGYKEITFAVKNMIANLTGMICDGAKPSCSLKVTSGVSTAVFSAMMAMEGKSVTSVEGIIDDDVDQSIRNLTSIGKEGMNETDKLILRIMTCK